MIEVDPTNPDIVYAGGSFGYDLSPQSGGIFRSTDGGAHLAEPRLGSPSGLPRARDGSVEPEPRPDRERRRRLVQPGPRRPSGPTEPVERVRLAGPERHGRSGDWRRRLHRSRSLADPVHVDRNRSDGCSRRCLRAVLGRHAGQRHPAEVGQLESWFDVAGGDGGQVLVDPSSRQPELGLSSSAPATSTARTSGSRTRSSGSTTEATSSRTSSSRAAEPRRPVRLLRAVHDEPAQPEPAVHRLLSRVPQ